MQKIIGTILPSLFSKKINLIYFLIASSLSFLLYNKKYFLKIYKPFELILEKNNADLNAYLVAIHHMKKGGDPYIDYLGSDIAQYNYPSFFGIFAYIPGFCLDHIYTIAHIITALTILLILFIWKPTSVKTFLIFFTAILSPASVLAFERGNTDLIIFSLTAIAILNYKNKIVSNSLLLFAVFCKLFPIAAIGNLLFFQKMNKKNILLLVFFSLLFLLYLFIIRDEIMMILKNTPFDIYNFCYGFKEIPEIMRDKLAIDKTLIYFAYVPAFFIIFGVCFYYFKTYVTDLHHIKNDRHLYSLIVGALIFSFSFFIGINWDYRKIFLLFTLPFILNNHKIKSFKFAIAICMLILWEQLFVRVLFPKEINYTYIIANNIFILIYISFLTSVIYKVLLKNREL